MEEGAATLPCISLLEIEALIFFQLINYLLSHGINVQFGGIDCDIGGPFVEGLSEFEQFTDSRQRFSTSSRGLFPASRNVRFNITPGGAVR